MTEPISISRAAVRTRRTAAGTNEWSDGIVTLHRIDVHSTLRTPSGTREAAPPS